MHIITVDRVIYMIIGIDNVIVDYIVCCINASIVILFFHIDILMVVLIFIVLISYAFIMTFNCIGYNFTDIRFIKIFVIIVIGFLGDGVKRTLLAKG
jgi:hypothetical protein